MPFQKHLSNLFGDLRLEFLQPVPEHRSIALRKVLHLRVTDDFSREIGRLRWS
jgi:hypothetical protein